MAAKFPDLRIYYHDIYSLIQSLAYIHTCKRQLEEANRATYGSYLSVNEASFQLFSIWLRKTDCPDFYGDDVPHQYSQDFKFSASEASGGISIKSYIPIMKE